MKGPRHNCLRQRPVPPFCSRKNKVLATAWKRQLACQQKNGMAKRRTKASKWYKGVVFSVAWAARRKLCGRSKTIIHGWPMKESLSFLLCSNSESEFNDSRFHIKYRDLNDSRPTNNLSRVDDAYIGSRGPCMDKGTYVFEVHKFQRQQLFK
ncbi:hypothetical protein NPIL_439251 [Nephila pilipes]|uniref:Uncharacterized protein n=1 Tax=Nephila pilipes TaxID=299642 RepID=A0A8X6N4J6_NEPPI|nr:hypothetical protein NPIL_439251 [Nephila pilipes]